MNESSKQNLELQVFTPFIGEWTTTGTHPYLPGKTFHGHATFEWIEQGAFVRSYSEIDEPEIPSNTTIFGSDNVTGEYFMLYFDERGISRKFNVSFEGTVMTWSRESKEFSQRMVFTISDDGKTIVEKGEMSKDSGAWEADLSVTYTRK